MTWFALAGAIVGVGGSVAAVIVIFAVIGALPFS